MTAAPARPRTAVVLAAGSSQRMCAVTGGGSKLLAQIGGMSLIERSVRGVAREVDRVVVLVGHDPDRVAGRAARAAPGRVQIVRATGWERGNGATLAAAPPALRDEPLLLLVAGDHLFADGTLSALVDAGGPAALVDPTPGRDVLEEATRVVVAGGRAVRFGKEGPSCCTDCGAFVVPPAIFACQRQAAAAGDMTLAGAVSRLAALTPLVAVPVGPSDWWQDVDTPADLHRARERVRRSLGRLSDGPVARLVNRPLSTRLSMLLAPLRLPPDLVSVAVCGLGLLAGAVLATGQPVVGAALAQATSVLDGVDGELARLQDRVTPRGAMLDGVLDRCADTAIAAGLGRWALARGRDPASTLVLAVAASAASLLSMATKDRAAALGLPRDRERALSFLLGGRDGRLLLVAVFALLRRPAAGLLAITLTAGIASALRVRLASR